MILKFKVGDEVIVKSGIKLSSKHEKKFDGITGFITAIYPWLNEAAYLIFFPYYPNQKREDLCFSFFEYAIEKVDSSE